MGACRLLFHDRRRPLLQRLRLGVDAASTLDPRPWTLDALHALHGGDELSRAQAHPPFALERGAALGLGRPCRLMDLRL